ncbi:hypothetical protein [Kosakonia cowanii]|uniref:hypothetical protein n=1 Tax=Kosakonia cowanii TaxID=208223 RepID=UPI0028A246F0|nr:hypothetical protein [Kosakonia cowanii]
MIKGFQRWSLCSFVLFSTIGFCLYFGFFSFYLVKIKTSPFIISLLIGSTALTSLFWGPVAGRIIDRAHHRFYWLLIAQACCGICVLLFGIQATFRPILTPILVITFSLALNFATIIVNQYLIPHLHENYEKSVSTASYISGLAVFFSGIALAILYDRFTPIIFFSIAFVCFLLSVMNIVPLLRVSTNISGGEKINETSKNKHGIYYQSYQVLRKNWFLAFSMCIIAFTETSFNTNFDVIAFTTGTTPFAAVFLMGAICGILDSLASWLYPKAIGNTTVTFRWFFFLSTFLIIFMVATLLTLYGYNNNPWFLPSLALLLELTGVWWAIFIAGRVRDASHDGNYGQTMAAFRVPRSVVTFIGVTSIGTALQSGKIEWILFLNTMLLTIILVFNIYRQFNKRYSNMRKGNPAVPHE